MSLDLWLFFPLELEREIFEMAAYFYPETIFSLVLVSRRVHVVMPRAWLGLKARAWAWLGQAWAWTISSLSPSLLTGLGLAWLGLRPGLGVTR